MQKRSFQKLFVGRLTALFLFGFLLVVGIFTLPSSIMAGAVTNYISVDLSKATCSDFTEMNEETAVHTTRIRVCQSASDWGHNVINLSAPNLLGHVLVNGKSVAEYQNAYLASGSPALDTTDIYIKEYGCAPMYVYFTYAEGYNVIDICIPESYLPATSIKSVGIAGGFTYTCEDFSATHIYSLSGTITLENPKVAKPTYTVTIDGVAQEVREGECIQQPTKQPTKAETEFAVYKFSGWVNAKTGETFDFSQPIMQDTEIISTFTETRKFLVTINGVSKRVLENTRLTEPPKPSKPSTATHYYVFKGWKYAGGYWDFAKDVVKGDVTLTADFEEIEKTIRTITLEANNGETLSPIQVYDGNCIEASQLPQKLKKYYGNRVYVLAFWSVDGRTKFDCSTPIDRDLTLKAVYVQATVYTVTIDGVSQKVVEGELAIAPQTLPTKESTTTHYYVFKGWKYAGGYWNFEEDIVTKNITLTAEFERVEKARYTVKFQPNNGERVQTIVVHEGNVIEESMLPDNPTKKEGDTVYAFRFWSANGVDPYDFTLPTTSHLTLVAVYYTVEVYTVTIDGIPQRVEAGKLAVRPTVDPYKESSYTHEYVFKGWMSEGKYWDFERDVVTKDLTLTAYFEEVEKEIHTVKLHPDNGEDILSIAVYDGNPIETTRLPANPSKTGEGKVYAFEYWSLDGLSPFDFSTPIREDLHLIAVYTDRAFYKVTIDGSVQYVQAGDMVKKPSVEPTKSGTYTHYYVFKGWKYADGYWDFAKDVVTGDLVLTADFEEVEKPLWMVTFNPDNGESATVVEVYDGTYVEEVRIPDAPVKVGLVEYTFLYWSADGETAFDFSTRIFADTTLQAVYDSIPIYTVTIDGEEQKVVEGHCAVRPKKDPIKAETESYAYRFLGWFIKDMGAPFDFSTVIYQHVILTAQFEEIPKYLVTIDGVSQRVQRGAYLEKPSEEPTRSDTETHTYIFMGWYDVQTNTPFDFTTPVTSNLILQATFRGIAKYTVVIDGEELVVLNGEHLKEPAYTPSKEESESHTYTFLGWAYIHASGVKKLWNFALDTVHSNLDLSAEFVAHEKPLYTVTFDPVNGTAPLQTKVYEGGFIPLENRPADPKKTQNGHTRYVFSCWSQDGIVAWDFERDRVFASITLKAYYVETIGFVVSFDEEMQAHEANTLLEKPTDPQRPSTAEYQYTFAGWYYLKDGELVAWDFEKDLVTFDVALVSKFTANKRKYELTIDYGQFGPTITQKIAWGETIVYPKVSAQVGYEMFGWVDDKGQMAPKVMPKANVFVQANWRIVEYTASVLCSNGVTHQETFTIDTRADVVTQLEVYLQGMQSKQYTYAWDMPLPKELPLANCSFTAKATKVRYQLTVIEDPDNAQATTRQTALYWGEETKLSLPNTHRGRRFLGWVTDQGQTAPYVMPTNNLTVYGKWEWYTYSMTIIDGNGQAEQITYTVKEADNPLYVKALFNQYLIPENNAAYTYGWNVAIPSTLPLESGRVYQIVAEAKVYTLTFEGAQGISPLRFTAETLSTLVLPEPPGRIGYTAKWDTLLSEIELADKTITAIYTPKVYTLRFAGVLDVEPITFTIETLDTLVLPKLPVKEGYKVYWDKSLSEIGLEDTTITATYAPIEYTITFLNANNVSPIKFTVETLPTLLLPTIPPKVGYTAKWSKTIEEIGLEDTTVMAIYTPIVYTLTFEGLEGVDCILFTVETLPYLSFPQIPKKDGYEGRWDKSPSEIKPEDTTVCLIYTQISYTVTFVGVEGIEPITFTVDTISSVVFPEVPGKIGYTRAWSMKESELLLQDTVVTVVDTPIVYTLTFVGAEGVAPITFTVETAGRVQLPSLPEKRGYTGKWDCDLSEIGLQNKTITAIYTPITYTLTFVTQEGESKVQFTVETVKQLQFPQPPVREGYMVAWDTTLEEVGLADAVITAIYTKITPDSSVNSTEESSSTPPHSSGNSSTIEEPERGCGSAMALSSFIGVLASVALASLHKKREE